MGYVLQLKWNIFDICWTLMAFSPVLWCTKRSVTIIAVQKLLINESKKYGVLATYLLPIVLNLLISGEGKTQILRAQHRRQTVGRPFAVHCTDFAKSLTDYLQLWLGPWTLLSQMSHHFLFFSSAVFLDASKCQTSDSLIFLHLKSVVICDGSKWWYSRKCLSAWLIMW